MSSHEQRDVGSGDPGRRSSAGGQSVHQGRAAPEAAQRLKDSAGTAGKTLKQEAQHYAAERESRAGVVLGDVGAAVREAARCLRERDDQTAASWTDTVADRIESFAAELQQGDPQHLTRSMADFARRHPEVSVAGMFAAGLGIARFLKSTGDRPERREEEDAGETAALTAEARGGSHYGSVDSGSQGEQQW